MSDHKGFDIKPERLAQVCVIKHGGHSGFAGTDDRPGSMCVMEAVSWITGAVRENGSMTDRPKCTNHNLAGIMITLNDWFSVRQFVNPVRMVSDDGTGMTVSEKCDRVLRIVDEIRSATLLPLIPFIVGTNPTREVTTWSGRLADREIVTDLSALQQKRFKSLRYSIAELGEFIGNTISFDWDLVGEHYLCSDDELRAAIQEIVDTSVMPVVAQIKKIGLALQQAVRDHYGIVDEPVPVEPVQEPAQTLSDFMNDLVAQQELVEVEL